MDRATHVTLVTGFPGRQLATHLVRELSGDDRVSIRCLVTEHQHERALEIIGSLPHESQSRISTLIGDPRALDLGLSGDEFASLTKDLD
ncbi:MAG: SDR family oxidoreductase, partial [Polyangiales bacterium]